MPARSIDRLAQATQAVAEPVSLGIPDRASTRAIGAASAAHCAVRLRAAASHLGRQLRAALPAEAIGVARLSVLGQLHRHGPLTPTELAQHERVKLQSLTRLLAELEADGWIARHPHGSDGRQSLLSLTTVGTKRLTADVHRREASLVTVIAAKLTDDEQALLLRACELIDRVAAGLSAGAASR